MESEKKITIEEIFKVEVENYGLNRSDEFYQGIKDVLNLVTNNACVRRGYQIGTSENDAYMYGRHIGHKLADTYGLFLN